MIAFMCTIMSAALVVILGVSAALMMLVRDPYSAGALLIMALVFLFLFVRAVRFLER
jgi:Mn2+/Fe2+ NRAMP family transporter